MKPLRRVTPAELAAIHERARTYEEALGVAQTFEKKGADAGTVRLALQFLARDAKDEANLCVLEAADDPILERPTSSAASSALEEPEPPQVPFRRSWGHPPGSGSSSADGIPGQEAARPRSLTHAEDAYLEGIARGMDMAFRVAFAPEPQSLRVDLDDRPHLRVVE